MEVKCPKCGEPLSVEGDRADKPLTCPGCGGVVKAAAGAGQAGADTENMAEVLFKNAVAAILADAVVDEREKTVLERARRLLDIDPAVAKQWIRDVGRDPSGIIRASAAEVRSHSLNLMIAACKVDGIIRGRERKLLEQTAADFGIPLAELTDRLHAVTFASVHEELHQFLERVKAGPQA